MGDKINVEEIFAENVFTVSTMREYLPEGFFQRLSYDEPITMMNLMNHNAGWQETTRPIWKTDENEILTLREELQAIEPLQINRPGEVVAYSNYGAAVAGYVIECITNQDYCEYVHENIFEPLGMEHTALDPAHSDNAFVYGQRRKMKSYRYIMSVPICLGNSLYYLPAYPAGAATGTLSDLIIYGQALVNDEAPFFESPDTQKMMFSSTDFYCDSDIPECAHGFWCSEYAVRVYGHSGATTSGQADLEFDLESKTGAAVMVNEPEGNDFLTDVPHYVFGELSPDKYPAVSGETKVSGSYVMSRSILRGMMKFTAYITEIPGGIIGTVEDTGNGVYRKISKGEINPEAAAVVGMSKNPDGSITIETPSIELKSDRSYILKLGLFTAYVLLSVAAVYLLLIRLKLKKHGKYVAYAGQSAVFAGQYSWFASLSVLIASYVIFHKYSGIPITAGKIIGSLQIICMAVCGISALLSAAAALKEKKHHLRYISCIIGDIVTITAVLYYEMYIFV